MTRSGAEIISKKLKDIDYAGTIAISGFGENLLNPDIIGIVEVFREHNRECYIELNTNGDPLNERIALALINAGLTCLNINLYDGPGQVERFETMLSNLPDGSYKYRAHWNPDDYGIIFNNRSGLITWIDESGSQENKNKPCYYPFYKMMIDWNGDVLFCANDWGRTRVVGNVLQQPIRDIWLSKHMKKIRMRLADANRNFKPCDTCSVNGTLVGRKSFDLIMENYGANRDNRDQ
jgi:radical SAM protein with 4Fe4S-binding SPASM domain